MTGGETKITWHFWQTSFGLRVSVWPVELSRLVLAVQEQCVLHFGDPNSAHHIDLLYWTRNSSGLHFDVLLRCPELHRNAKDLEVSHRSQ